MADKRISQLAERTDLANNDVVAIVASGATATNKATMSSIQAFMQGALDVGVTSVGVTISEIDTAPISVTGSPITQNSNITINLPRATNSIRGVLDTEDFINFSNKQNTITLTTSGTSGDATFDGSLLNIPNYTTDTSGFVTLDTDQTITGIKTFGNNALQVASGGSGSFPTVIRNITVNSLISGGLNHLGFNNLNNIYFSKGSGSFNAGVFAFNNTGTRTYTLQDASGTLALTSDFTGFVTLDTAQTITGTKIFTNGISIGVSGINGYSISTDTGSEKSKFTFGTKAFIFNVNSIPSFTTLTYTMPDASGTLALTSDLNAYLPLTGGTLTGTLNGTSAVFSGGVNLATVSGNVGIGVTGTPSVKLQVEGGDSVISNIRILNFFNSFANGISTPVIGRASSFAGFPTGTLLLQSRSDSSGGDIAFITGATTSASERLRITSTGNVGIGTNQPNQRLHLSDGKILIAAGSNNLTNKFNSQGISVASSPVSLAFNGLPAERPEIAFYRGGRTFPEFAIREHTTADKGAEFYSGNGQGVPTMTMALNSGNVGIGTPAPSAKLEVNGAIKTGNPSGSSAQPFKIGAVNNESDKSFQGNILIVEVNNVIYRLMIAE